MDFDFSFEQTQLAGSVGRMLDGFQTVTDGPPFPYPAGDVVKAAADVGLFATEDGRSLLGHVDAVAAAYEIGRRLPAAPLTEMLAAALGLVSTDARVDAALSEGATIGVAVAGGLRMGGGGADGRLLVSFAADAALVVAPCEKDGQTGWLALDPAQATSEPAEVLDITTDARWLCFANAPIDQGNRPDSGRFDDALRLLVLAEMAGAAAECLATTVAYVKERKQFDKPVGSNQAVKHMAASAATALEAMKAAVEYAAWSFDQAPGDDPRALVEARLALLTARSFVGDNAKTIAEHCVQMHGGIAFTWDYGLHRYLKRIAYRRGTLAGPREARVILAGTLLEDALAM